jgi:uncharacterized protein (DUF2336 family)
MATRLNIIDELEESLSGHTIGYRAGKLRRISDLFLEAAASYSDAEVALFDDVMTRLIDEMQDSLRSEIARRLADIPNAPLNLIGKLAADSAIEVAGPVLEKSPRLDEASLVEHARTKDQPHLLAISRRETVSEAVTDVLVERGDKAVALSTTGNPGARFSETGRTILVERAKHDDELATSVWARTDMPRHHLVRLFTAASEQVRAALESADSRRTVFIRGLVTDVADGIQDEMRAQSRDSAAAWEEVEAIHRAGRLDETVIEGFAAGGEFDKTAAALSILCDLPIGVIERALVQDRTELVLLLARAIGLSWSSTRTILELRVRPAPLSIRAREDALAAFSRTRTETARKALRFLRLRERANAAESDRSGSPA